MNTCLATVLLAAAATTATSQPILLVTEEEALASRRAPPILVPRAAPVAGAPTIEIHKPTLKGPIASPTPIEVRFVASPPATVKPETFKVLYGALRFDITSRLTRAAPISTEGISVNEAALPSGKHRLNLSIEDTLGRVGHRQIDLDIL